MIESVSQGLWDCSLPGSLYETPEGVDPDQQLLFQTSRGDEVSFCELYSLYGRQVYNYLLRLLREEPAAEDILQEVFLAVWRYAGNYQGRARVKTWLFRIAHNQAISWLRRDRLALPYEEIEADSGEASPEDQALESWRREQVRWALSWLSPKHRAVLEMAYLQDLSYQEIAEVVGCPVGTVKSRMNQAMRNLHGKLRERMV
jgi:RNA polymerase sigma-70 factor (ECF subfamily)